MEATKKKKAYLKPEMTKFEMKTEGTFMAASRVEIGDIVIVEDVSAQGNSGVLGGTWSLIKNNPEGTCVYTQFTGDGLNDPKFTARGFLPNDCLVIKVINSTGNNTVDIEATRVDCAGTSPYVTTCTTSNE